MQPKLTFIIGCTGCGKGSLGRHLADRLDAEIISLDSMKVYRRMDVGTAKPSKEVLGEIPHHLIDVAEPSEDFSAARFVELSEKAIAAIHSRGKKVLVVGGTPLYLKALIEGLFDGPSADQAIRDRLREESVRDGKDVLHRRLQEIDPDASARIHPNDVRRVIRALEVYELTGQPISTLQTQWDRQRKRYDHQLIGLRRELEDQNHRTNARVRRMMDAGLVKEVRSLLDEPTPLSVGARQALGYAELIRHLDGEMPLEDAVELIKINTRQFAKSQRTWFKRFSETHWMDLTAESTVDEVADELLQREGVLWSA